MIAAQCIQAPGHGFNDLLKFKASIRNEKKGDFQTLNVARLPVRMSWSEY